jgi:beta-1,4-N-acetylglucosaminyltransferase
MIFVTVGTTAFDDLIRHVDIAVQEKTLKDEVIAQIGKGIYEPRNLNFFRFEPSLQPYLEQADMVVSHGGAGSIFETLTLKKKLIVVANPHVRGGHQREIMLKLGRLKVLLCCPTAEQIASCLKKAQTMEFKEYHSPNSIIASCLLEED